MHIVLLRFQGVPKELPQQLEAPLREVFSLPVSTAPRALRLPPAAYYQDREQWRAAALLSTVEAAPAQGEPPRAVRLGIAAHDMFATGLNFVFGEASSRARCAVFSIARLDDAFYGLQPSTPDAFLERCRTEAVHELGHEKRRCIYCEGTGYLTCGNCVGRGMSGAEVCANCAGTGKVMCTSCLCTGKKLATEHDPRVDPFTLGMME